MAGNSSIAKVDDTVSVVRGMLKREYNDLKKSVPKRTDPGRLIKVALGAIQSNRGLLKCDPVSLVDAISNAAKLGLEVNDGTGRAYLVPYGSKANLIIGYTGLIELAYRSGYVVSIYSYAVFDDDEFELSLGTNKGINHVPKGKSSPEKLTHVYAVCELKTGGCLFEVMTRSQVEDIRLRSRAKGGPWSTDYIEMARKTAIRKLCKMIPKNPDLQAAINNDFSAELGPFDSSPKGEISSSDVVLEQVDYDEETGEIFEKEDTVK